MGDLLGVGFSWDWQGVGFYGTGTMPVFFMYFHTKLQVGFRSFKKMLPEIKKRNRSGAGGGENRLPS